MLHIAKRQFWAPCLYKSQLFLPLFLTARLSCHTSLFCIPSSSCPSPLLYSSRKDCFLGVICSLFFTSHYNTHDGEIVLSFSCEWVFYPHMYYIPSLQSVSVFSFLYTCILAYWAKMYKQYNAHIFKCMVRWILTTIHRQHLCGFCWQSCTQRQWLVISIKITYVYQLI